MPHYNFTYTKKLYDEGEVNEREAALRAELDAAKAERDEARELVRHSSGMRSRSLEAIIARWDAERAAPVTNRDAGDESGA